MLAQKGYSFTDDEQEAEAVVVNTCCFIGDAKEESINTILEMAELKKSGKVRALLVAGCLAQRYFDEIQKEIPQVDAVIGTTAIDAVTDALSEVLSGRASNHIESIHRPVFGNGERVVTTGGHYAYLKIAEGCNKRCTYCIIPKVRGDFRSVPIEDLCREAERLAKGGAKELILVAQETTLYGTDLYGKKMLPELLTKLCGIRELSWIRILYCYPEEITDELIEVLKREEKICHYLDMPIQSGSNRILKRMGRKTSRQQICERIRKLREEIPDICIRTTLIAGFPGETDADHAETMSLVDEMEFDRLGVFTYSQEEDTPAAEMPDQVPEEVKEKRRGEIMELQQEIAFAAAAQMTGRCVDALIEGKMAEEDVYVARTYKDAPSVDGYLFIDTKRNFMSGDFVKVMITGSNEYDLIGEVAVDGRKE